MPISTSLVHGCLAGRARHFQYADVQLPTEPCQATTTYDYQAVVQRGGGSVFGSVVGSNPTPRNQSLDI